MDKCPMCGYVDPSTKQNIPQTAHMNKYLVDSLSEGETEVGGKVINSNERYLTIKDVIHRRSDLIKGAPKEAPVKKVTSTSATPNGSSTPIVAPIIATSAQSVPNAIVK